VYLPDIEVHEAATLEEAAALLSRFGNQARLLAGGTDLLVDLKSGRASAHHLVSIQKIEPLRGVETTPGGLRIGALTTINQLHDALDPHGPFAPLLDATRQMAAPQVRNLATVGGNLASAVPCADLPPILIAMKADVLLWSPDGERRLGLHEFFVDVRRTALRLNEVVRTVLVPHPPARFGAAYARFALREGNGIAVAAVAAGLRLDENGTIAQARIVLGAVAPIPKLAASAATALVGQSADADAFARAATAAMEEAEPISDVRGSAEFRRELVGVLTRRALHEAARRARGEQNA